MISNYLTKKNAQIAGLLYLGIVLTGIFSLMYVPSKLIILTDPDATFKNISTHENLFRLGIINGLICYTFFIFLPLVLYKLLNTVSKTHAKLMVIFALASVPMFFINVQNELTILSLINPEVNLFSEEQTRSQILLQVIQYNNGLRIIHIFSGLWLFPFGYLVFKSGFLPKFFGILLMMGCFGYLINFFGKILIPKYSDLGISTYVSLPASAGEIGICLWLLIIGVKQKKD